MKYIEKENTIHKIPENQIEYAELQKEYPHLNNFRSVIQAYKKCLICGDFQMPEFDNRCACRFEGQI